MNEIQTQRTELAEISFSNDLFQRFMDYTDVKEVTLKGYTVCIRHFMRWLAEEGIRQPQREDVKTYKEYLNDCTSEKTGAKLSAGTRSQYLRAVKHFFKWTASEGLYPNVADNIKGVKLRAVGHHDAFETDQIFRIWETIDRSTETGCRNYAIMRILSANGCRIIEMQRADIGDLQIVDGAAFLMIQRKGHEEKDARISLPEGAAAALSEYLTRYRSGAKKGDPLFTSTSNNNKGKRISEPSISQIIKDILKNAGYDDHRLTAHSLRASAGTIITEATGDIHRGQLLLGHTDPSMTSRYVQARAQKKNRDSQIVEDLITGKKSSHRREQLLAIFDRLSEEDQIELLKAAQERVFTVKAACVS